MNCRVKINYIGNQLELSLLIIEYQEFALVHKQLIIVEVLTLEYPR